MRYLDVLWRHDLADDPVRLLSEIDDDGYESRKIEVYRDGRAGYADPERSAGDTLLGDQPVPSDDVVAAMPDFELRPIDAATFDALWREAIQAERLSPK